MTMLRLFETDEERLEPTLQMPAVQPEPQPQPKSQPEPQPLASGGQTLSFGATPGSPGATSLAINVAFELALAKHKVCVLDFDFHSPNLLATLAQESITAGLMGAKRLLSQQRLTGDELNRFLMVLNFDGTKVSVLPGLGSPAKETTPLDVDSATALIALAKSQFDYVLIDVGDLTRNLEFSEGILKSVDLSFLICAGDPIGVRRFLWLKQRLDETALESAQLIVNRVRESVLGSNPKRQLADTLWRLANTEVCAFLPNDSLAFDQALLDGLPIQLLKKASPARHAVAMLVRQGILNQRSNLDWRMARHG